MTSPVVPASPPPSAGDDWPELASATAPKGLAARIREVWSYRDLLRNLVVKELKVKYKDSALGFVWTLVRPLLYLLVYSVAIGIFSGRAGPSRTSACTCSRVSSSGPCSPTSSAGRHRRSSRTPAWSKVYFPGELLTFSVVGAAMINALLQVVVLIGAYVVTRQFPPISDLYLVPLAVSCWSSSRPPSASSSARSTCTCATSSTSSRSVCCCGSG